MRETSYTQQIRRQIAIIAEYEQTGNKSGLPMPPLLETTDVCYINQPRTWSLVHM